QKEDRQRTFRAFVQQWLAEIVRTPEHDRTKLWSDYSSKSALFAAEASKVQGDFAPVDEFRKACDRLAGFRQHEVTQDPQQKKARDIIADAIRDVIRFTDAG